MMYIMCVKKHIIQTVLFCILEITSVHCSFLYAVSHISHGKQMVPRILRDFVFHGDWGLHLGNGILLRFHNASPVLSGDCIETIANTMNYNWSFRGQKYFVQQHMKSHPSVVKSCIQFPKSIHCFPAFGI